MLEGVVKARWLILKKIPYGQCNFADIITRNYAYVDKTRYLEILENENSSYHLMLRPRRFGKSLFLSVLQNYYDISRKDRFETLFGGLYIGSNPTPDQGTYAVMAFDFSGMDTTDYETFRDGFLGEIEHGVNMFLKRYGRIFSGITGEDMLVSEPSPGISALLSAFGAAEYAEVPVFIIIDEYDHFSNRLLAMGDTYKDEVGRAGLVRAFYEALKKATRTVVRRIFMTGVSPMMVNDLTSGFNIPDNISLQPKYNGMFGFTSSEVEWLISETGIDKELINIDIEYYYNGYRFNNDTDEKVYNSQMVLYLLNQISQLGKLPPQIVDPNLKTSYERLQRLAKVEKNRERLLAIMKDGGTDGEIYREFSVDDMGNEEHFVSLLFYLGMLTYGNNEYNKPFLKIPNYSIQTLYWEYLVEYISRGLGEDAIDTPKLTSVIEDMAYKGDVEPYLDFFVEYFLKRLSNRDLRDFDEKYIKVMMLSSLYLSKLYSPISEAENINGYSDIYLARRNVTPEVKYEYVFEVKYIKKSDASETEIEKEFFDAMSQIEEYRKDSRFFRPASEDVRDDIKFYAFVFIGKDRCEVREVMPRRSA